MIVNHKWFKITEFQKVVKSGIMLYKRKKKKPQWKHGNGSHLGGCLSGSN